MTDAGFGSLTEYNAAIEEALDALADAALDWFDTSPAEPAQVRNRLLNAADAYGHAVRARAEWRAKIQAEYRHELGRRMIDESVWGPQ